MPQVKIRIEKINRREVSGPKGPWWSVSYLAEGKWYSSPANEFTKDWKEGQTVEFEYVEKPSRDPGKPFLNIVNPNRKAPQQMGTDSQVLDEINGKLNQIMAEILAIKAIVTFPASESDNPPPHTDADAPF
jgi:hypothetical protein